MSGRAKRAPLRICGICEGEGHTSQHLGVVDPRDFDPDEWERYLTDGYDITCGDCNGRGMVREDHAPIVRHGSDGARYLYADADDASEHFLRMAGG